MRTAERIAFLARRYRLLAEREVLCGLRRNREARADYLDHAEALGYPLMDAVQVLGAGELDFICAEAVRELARPGARTEAALRLLSWLDHERLVAIAYALPEDRRHVVQRHGVWAYAYNHAPPGMAAALRRVAEVNAIGPVTSVGRWLLSEAAADLAAEVRA